MESARRDSVCAQCHLTGEERIERPGKRLSAFRPGERLADYADYFVAPGSGMRAASHVERLSASLCRKKSGDRMWCGTCHDPHASPAPDARANHFRAKCLGCHGEQQCRRGAECTGCHMPKSPVIDAGHSVLTDHSIPRRPRVPPLTATTELILFGKGKPGNRALGLAYANLAVRSGDRRQLAKAVQFLQQADPKDSLVLTQLGYWEQMRERIEVAASLYEAALRQDPQRNVAAVNLGNILAQKGDLDRAEVLWREVFERDPATSEAGINLAIALRRKGRLSEARQVLQRALRFDPASAPARSLLVELETRP
jgi:predicted CXXCH cytochrome family protein